MTDSERPHGIPTLTAEERRAFLEQLRAFEAPEGMETAIERHREHLQD